MKRFYSRFATEESKNVRSAAFFILLTIGTIVFLIFVGIPILGKVTAFISDLRGGGRAITKNDITPPPPPKFNTFPDFTNQQSLTLTGNSEAGATVKLTFNSTAVEALAGKDGGFSFNLTLTNGENTFSAVAQDASGNQSKKTSDYTITFDTKPPALAINSPTDGSSFFGSSQRQITVQGTTDPNCQVVINDRIITVDDNGNFQYTTTLSDGANQFTVKSTDQAGNTTEKGITLNFTP
jgi:hypothetical protein